MLSIKTFEFNMLPVNTYVVWDESKEAVVIDCGCYYEAEKQAFKLVVGDPVFLAGTDVKEMVPEIFSEMTGGVFRNKVAHKSAGILNRAPLKHAVDGNMEHDRVHILKDVRIKNTALAHYYPVFDAAFNECAFCNGL